MGKLKEGGKSLLNCSSTRMFDYSNARMFDCSNARMLEIIMHYELCIMNCAL